MSDFMDQIARDKANEASHHLRNHIAVTDIKIQNLERKIDDHHKDHSAKLDQLISILKWAGGLIVMLFISTLTWSLTQQYNSNESTKKDLAQQVELLKGQRRNDIEALQDRQEILSRLPAPSATETPTAPVAGR